MSIKDLTEKIKWQGRESLARLRGNETIEKYFTTAVVVLVALSSYGLGRLSVLEEAKTPVTIEEDGALVEDVSSQTIKPTSQSASVGSIANASTNNKIVASKTGTKYYFPWCSSNIADKNKIWFNSEADARAKGYQPAANCKGLK